MKNPIIRLAGFPIFENHTRRNGIGSLNIRIIKTFYMAWFFGKSEEFFHLRHDAVGMSFWIYYLHLLEFFHAVFHCVFLGKLYDTLFVAQFRDNQLHMWNFYIEMKRKKNFRRSRIKFIPNLYQGFFQYFFIGFVQHFFDFCGVGLNNRTVFNFEIIDISRRFITDNTENIHIVYIGTYDSGMGLVIC